MSNDSRQQLKEFRQQVETCTTGAPLGYRALISMIMKSLSVLILSLIERIEKLEKERQP